MRIERENHYIAITSGEITLTNGDIEIGAVEIKDHDSDLRAEVTPAGLAVEDRSPWLIGDAVWIAIDGTERRLDTTPLVGAGYPMKLELEARDEGCSLKQGDIAITLAAGGPNYRLLSDSWRIATVSGANEAYFAVQRYDVAGSGTLVATRIDLL
jgi:hypothetical protein